MKKKVFGRKLSRSKPAREALFASLIRSLILNGKIVTTKAKAKAVQGEVEKYITSAKKAALSDRRRILASLDNADDAVKALYGKVVPAFQNKTSGFTRIINLPPRKGDNARIASLEWTEKTEEPKPAKEKKETKAKTAKEAKPKKKTK